MFYLFRETAESMLPPVVAVIRIFTCLIVEGIAMTALALLLIALRATFPEAFYELNLEELSPQTYSRWVIHLLLAAIALNVILLFPFWRILFLWCYRGAKS